MEYKYDAFISYRHAEKDTLIASEIQKSLERFRIPKAIQKQTGKERFNRIFRDVEELPISSNLTEELTEALRLSQYLIVICSYKTSESDWVKREIDTFLELHDYNKQLILTVLVEGEPDEVIPEILRHDNITHYLADGTFYCRDEVVEPLAANYRMPIAKARKTELPRLAASMLGCNYDDIIRRRKAFKRRRLLIETAVISAAAIVLMVYIGWMMMRIQDSLRNSQMSQSRYLASESQKLLADGDRLGAIHLAIAALEDSNGNLRPETSEARYALSAALGAYSVSGTTYSAPVWRYESSSTIVKYEQNTKLDRLAILEASGKINIWSTKDHMLVNTLQNEKDSFFDFCYDKDDNLIAFNRDFVALYDTRTWKELWVCDHPSDTIIRDTKKSYTYSSEKNRIVVNCKTMLMFVDATTGEVVETLELKDPVFDEFGKAKKSSENKENDEDKENGEDKEIEKKSKIAIDSFAVDSELNKIVLCAENENTNKRALFLYDKKAGKWICLNKETEKILKHGFDNKGNLVVLRRLKEDGVANSFDNKDMLYDYNVNIEMFNEKGKSLWNTNVPAMSRIIDIQAYKCSYTLSDGKETDVVIASFANKCVVLNFKDGKIIKSFSLLGSVIGSAWYSNGFGLITRDGMKMIIPLKENTHTVYSEQMFNEGMMKAAIYMENKDFSYLVEDDTQKAITEYSSNFSDSTYTGFEGSEQKSIITEAIKCGKYLITLSGSADLTCYDLETHKLVWTKDDSKLLYLIDGATNDNKYVFLLRKSEKTSESKTYELVKVNCEDGQIISANSEFGSTKKDGVIVRKDNIWSHYYDSKEKAITLYSYNMSKDTVNKIVSKISTEITSFSYFGNFTVSADGKKAFVYFKNSRSETKGYYRMEIDCVSGVSKLVETNGFKAVWSDNGERFAELTEDGKICVYSKTGNTIYTVNTEMRSVKGMAFENEDLYVFYSNELLNAFDKQGNQKIDIFLSHGVDENSLDFGFEFKFDYLFLTNGSFTDIINLKDGRSIGFMLGYVCNYSKTNKHTNLYDSIIVCRSFYTGPKTILGYFEFKTTNRLLTQAKEYLKGTPPRDELKRKYGL